MLNFSALCGAPFLHIPARSKRQEALRQKQILPLDARVPALGNGSIYAHPHFLVLKCAGHAESLSPKSEFCG